MKRIAGLLVIALGSWMMLYAQGQSQKSGDQDKGQEMTGWICNSKCVKQTAATAACDETCTDKSGDVVFVDETGKVTKIANPDMVMDKMGKKVKVKGEMMKDQDMMKVYDVLSLTTG
jgi:hypothetical protein